MSDDPETARSRHLLEPRPEEEQREHVHQQMQRIGMHEAGRNQAVIFVAAPDRLHVHHQRIDQARIVEAGDADGHGDEQHQQRDRRMQDEQAHGGGPAGGGSVVVAVIRAVVQAVMIRAILIRTVRRGGG